MAKRITNMRLTYIVIGIHSNLITLVRFNQRIFSKYPLYNSVFERYSIGFIRLHTQGSFQESLCQPSTVNWIVPSGNHEQKDQNQQHNASGTNRRFSAQPKCLEDKSCCGR